MEFSKLDLLSPQITFFFFGKCRHSSSIGGVLTLFMILLCIYYIIHMLIVYISPKSILIQFHRNYSKNEIKYSFSNSEIFHYFEFYSRNENSTIYYNPKYIRIFMMNFVSEYEPILLEHYDHWLYDNCIEEDIPLNNKEYINDLVNFTQRVCLRYYYNSKLNKYFSVNDTNNFILPSLISDNSKKNYYNLMTVIEKCNQNSISSIILGDCADENEIENYLKVYNSSFLHILNHEIDAYNHSTPIYSYMQEIYSSLNINNTIINNINFSPFKIKSQNRFLSHSKYKNTYVFEKNIKSIVSTKKNNCILGIYYYWLENNVQIFEFKYKNLFFDILPSIGGIIQLIYNIFFLMNLIFNKLKVIRDSQNLIFQYNGNIEEARSEQIKFSSIVKSLQLNNPRLRTNSQNLIKPSEIASMRHKSIMVCDGDNFKKINLKINPIDKKSNLDFNEIEYKKYPSYNVDNSRFSNIDEYDKTHDQLLTELNCMQINKINRNKKHKTFKKQISDIKMFENNNTQEIKNKPITYSDLVNKRQISNLTINRTHLLSLNKSNENFNDMHHDTHFSLKKQHRKSTFYPGNSNFEKEKLKIDAITLSKNSDRKNKEINRSRCVLKSDTNVNKNFLNNQKLKYVSKRKREKKRKINIIKSNCKLSHEKNIVETIEQTEHRNRNENGIDPLISVSKIRLSNHKFSLCDYLRSFFENKDKQNAIYIFEQFRKKLLSEEHNFKTSIFLCFSEKNFAEQKRKLDLIELYDNL